MNDIKNVTNINWSTAGSVAVGVALFGLVIWSIRKAPANAITNVAKKAADVATAA